jgi:hypothetical protein
MSNTSLIQTRSNVPATEMARVNVVSAVALITPLLIGALTTWATFNPVGVIVGLILGLLAWSICRFAWSRFVLDHSFRGFSFGVGGPTRDHDELRC